jgi:trigger factor
MNSSLKRLPKSEVELRFALDADKLTHAQQEAFNKIASQIKIPGFRPGKAPKNILAQQVNPNTVIQQALDVVLNETYQNVVKEHELVPVAQPEVHIDTIEADKPVQVTAKVAVRPDVELGDYKNIRIDKELINVTDEKLNETLGTIFERSNAPKPGANKKSTAPEEQETQPHDGALVATAEMDDAWAKKLGAKDLADLKAQVRRDMESQAQYDADTKWQEKIMEELISSTKVDLPEVFIQDELKRMQEQFHQQLQGVSMSMDQYVAQAGKSIEEMHEQWRPQAEKQATLEVSLAELANRENIKVDDVEVDEELAKTDSKTRAKFSDPEQRYFLHYTLWRQKVMKTLLAMVEAHAKA